MTVNYITNFGKIRHQIQLLFRWDGSVYKLIWIELLIFIAISYLFKLMRTFLLAPDAAERFDVFCRYNLQLSAAIPVAFILPFFVRLVIARRFDQYRSIPWVDKLAFYLCTFMSGRTEFVTKTKRTIIRYCVLSMALCFKSISEPSAKVFDDYDVFITSGLATSEELDKLTQATFQYNNYFTPIIWASQILHKADRRGAIIGERCVVMLLTEITLFHEKLQSIFFYDWINLPLVYTQVTTLCVYVYFFIALFGGMVIGYDVVKILYPHKNMSEIGNTTYDTSSEHMMEVIAKYITFVPTFECIMFGVYMGWLKVGESMINPYGDNDEDFETNAIIERNLRVGYLMVDYANGESPNITEDVIPIYLQSDFQAADIDINVFAASQVALSHADKSKLTLYTSTEKLARYQQTLHERQEDDENSGSTLTERVAIHNVLDDSDRKHYTGSDIEISEPSKADEINLKKDATDEPKSGKLKFKDLIIKK